MRIYEVKIVTDNILKAFRKLIPQLSPNGTLPTRMNLEEIVNSNNAIIFIAEDGDNILGTLTLVINIIPTGNKVWIEDVVVDELARGKGVGESLTQFAIDYTLSRGVIKIDLTSSPERIAANKLYQKLGFVKRETNVYRYILKE